MARLCSSCGSARSCSIRCAPAPDTDWYVETRTRCRPAASCSGFSTHVSGIVQQFGFATMPSCSSARAPFTSGTTSGTPGSSRYAADLSTATAPPRTACGTSSRDADVPTEKSARSMSPAASASGVASSTTIPPSSVAARRARRGECAHVLVAALAQQRSVTAPTAPVAPTTAMRGLSH